MIVEAVIGRTGPLRSATSTTTHHDRDDEHDERDYNTRFQQAQSRRKPSRN